ncbi:transposase [Aspergillus lentulus]|uniref:transposase n=1 Tax=Aspergillus lentulus TaxID=293939 RepID=UPI001392D49D|nr:transposase [Aspergillus lentulus]GFF55645.1 transposase [Aspergillus lentulus]GFF80063.1 transposase [Aspergillus lentulus]GFF96855.1 transposase [Aspergillus lentulus]GFG17919.1 transposase [Aspergillus lentulus]
MLEALCEHLKEKPTLYQDEMVVFLWDEFGKRVTIQSISRALASVGWSKKAARQVAKGQNADLRDYYVHTLSSFSSYQLVYVDESGCDKRVGFRRTGWSPLGVTPVQITKFRRDQRYKILPAYTQEGILLSRVFQGSTDARMFEDFIEQFFHPCNRWPEPRSVIIMDNASSHQTERVKQMWLSAGVKLLYLPPYSPDLNPIEEFFSDLKQFIKRRWNECEENPGQGFDAFLEWCIVVVGARMQSAKGHFRHVPADALVAKAEAYSSVYQMLEAQKVFSVLKVA